MIIYPAIDILNGKCVRLSQGDFNASKVYAENPLNMALAFEKAGVKNLHLVDLDGAKNGKVVNWGVVKSITANTKLKIDFGGGIKTEADIDELFTIGIDKVNVGSMAVRNPSLVKDWIKKHGAEKMILSADCRNDQLVISGWKDETAIAVIDFIRDFVDAGLRYVTVTDVTHDGMLSGPNIGLYKHILQTIGERQSVTINLIASGGVRTIDDLQTLKDIGCYGCIVGKAFYEGRISLTEMTGTW